MSILTIQNAYTNKHGQTKTNKTHKTQTARHRMMILKIHEHIIINMYICKHSYTYKTEINKTKPHQNQQKHNNINNNTHKQQHN